MSNTRRFWDFNDDLSGVPIFSTTAASNTGHPYQIAITGSGPPTIAVVDGSANGEVSIDHEATSEVQNACLYMGDNLQFDIDTIVEAWFDVKMNQATLDSTSMVTFGLIGDRNDTIDTIAQTALFRVIGADSTTNVVVETDDGTVDRNDIATGQTLVNAYKRFKINFATGTNDVRFFINGQAVATATTFDMSNYTGSLQLFAQLQKTADTNVDGFTIDGWGVRGRKL